MLLAVQKHFHYIPESALTFISKKSGISLTDLSGITTFYKGLRLKPAGEHTIRVCTGTACHIKGAEKIISSFRKALKIPEGQDTDKEHLFTLEEAACLGCCMLAPAVQIDYKIYGQVQPEEVTAIITDFLQGMDQKQTAKTLSPPRSGKNGEIRMCLCTSCQAAGQQNIYDSLLDLISLYHLPVMLKTVGCSGDSFQAPLIELIDLSGKSFHYTNLDVTQLLSILNQHFFPAHPLNKIKYLGDSFLDKWIISNTLSNQSAFSTKNDLYFQMQNSIITQFQGKLSPLSIADYQQAGGFQAFSKCLTALSPADVLKQVKLSKLRGRGGGGFSTALKWEAVREQKQTKKYLICNADEGDPGAFMDRMILESFPFRVIEGILIAAYTIGIHHGFIYIRQEYPLAIQIMKKAIEICQQNQILENNILNSHFDFHLEIVQGAGAFICGEESALIHSLEGKRASPHYRPPYPSEKGLLNYPTLVNNVETFASLPWIIQQGSSSFTKIGTSESTGTKVFALTGKVKKGGLIEVPMGITIEQIVFDIGGGIQGDKKFKAVQIGGPSGGCLPAHLGHLSIDYDDLLQYGTMMGSGGIIVLNEDDCLVDLARYYTQFTMKESCGKCTFCRIGLKQLLLIQENICSGKAKQKNLDQLETLSLQIQKASLCGLGKTAPNPVLSSLKYFKEEYSAHLAGHCPAGKCTALICYEITDHCIGCTLCYQNCPADAIASIPYQKHRIIKDKCIKCGTCKQVCQFQSVEVKICE
ncbi:MAG: NAD(P)H-dependent oxidoreductase subunit E [Spirochaetes bacterium]|nr:NAD(P)H-dependent oxidoreductase subunit E [Spirochaetota bacterium]